MPLADALYSELHKAMGGRLFTITVLNHQAGLAQRVYSSNPEAYPCLGVKPISQNAWTEQVVNQGHVFVANTVAEFAEYFADYPLIESLGCAAVLNVPVSEQGQVIGTVNILDREHQFPADTVERYVETVKQRYSQLVAAMKQCTFTA